MKIDSNYFSQNFENLKMENKNKNKNGVNLTHLDPAVLRKKREPPRYGINMCPLIA
jgi:hypothetical protein